jgi:hypothetical protein
VLTDHQHERIRMAKAAARHREQRDKYGAWLGGLAEWRWFGTFTNAVPRSSASAMALMKRYLNDLQTAAQGSIGWVVAEARGKSGRHHFHLLIAGVDHLSIEYWLRRAERLFGDCQLVRFDDGMNGAFYVANNGLSEGGDLHFGGDLLKGQQKRTKP